MQVILSALCPWLCNSRQPQHTLRMFTDHFGQDKPYHEKPLIRDCCNHKGSCIPYRQCYTIAARISSSSFVRVSTRQLAVSSLSKGISIFTRALVLTGLELATSRIQSEHCINWANLTGVGTCTESLHPMWKMEPKQYWNGLKLLIAGRGMVKIIGLRWSQKLITDGLYDNVNYTTKYKQLKFCFITKFLKILPFAWLKGYIFEVANILNAIWEQLRLWFRHSYTVPPLDPKVVFFSLPAEVYLSSGVKIS